MNLTQILTLMRSGYTLLLGLLFDLALATCFVGLAFLFFD